ncbi:MAG: tRNA (adenosine(37)-N6)-threonylcarbamoyltransferase complex transferase subunit TsaD [Candidatus Yanofskybacteria bacterium]|nr:tRNA (adenosine(37)-N6)-threonylcarbamoyltransferase complex transferase subunit TsaD [Candidatus Yanofskybacteria bacterium]
MLILGIETSCDDTAVAVLEVHPVKSPDGGTTKWLFDRVKVKSNVVSSQVKLHAKYGGVFPSLAAREHEKNLPKVLKLALKEAKIKIEDIDLIAVTKGPGLAPSLWRGVNFANELAKRFKKPITGVNHLEGHIYSNWLRPTGEKSKTQMTNDKIFPALNLIVSGGHTELVLMKGHGRYKIIGETLDDAVGEAFDKVARMLGLGYPGGPAVALRATKFKVESSSSYKIKFPRPMINSKDFNFSFSGLKTAVLYKTREFTRLPDGQEKLSPKIVNQICYEFQEAAIDVLISKTIKAGEKYKVKSVMLSGGVSANKSLREKLEKKISAELNNVKFFKPDMTYTSDNAAMIALAGYMKKKNAKQGSVKVDANLNLG